MVLVVGTPFFDTTCLLEQTDCGSGTIAYIALPRAEIDALLGRHLVRMETHFTPGRFGVEHVFFLERAFES